MGDSEKAACAAHDHSAEQEGGAVRMTDAGTSCVLGVAPPSRQRHCGGHDHGDMGRTGGGCSGAAVVGCEDMVVVEDDSNLPPRIRRSTKMTRRIQNSYGETETDGRIMCRYCSKRIVLGSAMRRVKRTGMCWHEECYMQAGRGGRLPPKIRTVRTMTKRIKKLYGGGDDHSVLCQMCGTEVEIGMKMRRACRTGMCWHEQCYRMTWGQCMRRAVAPRRPAYRISNAKWKRMLSDCLKCAGSRLCDYHREMEAMYRVPRGESGAVDVAADATTKGAKTATSAVVNTAAVVAAPAPIAR